MHGLNKRCNNTHNKKKFKKERKVYLDYLKRFVFHHVFKSLRLFERANDINKARNKQILILL